MMFEAKRGGRILYGFRGVEVTGHMYWEESRVWLPHGEHPASSKDEVACSMMPCRTFRAFKRFVRRHPEFKNKMCLVSRWMYMDVYA